MSYNGSGTFQINTSGQPVVAGTVISSTAFNALTADLATGLSTAITKDGQTTTTARIPFAAGINSSSATDSTSTSTGSIITSGGVGIAKALYVGTTANVASTTDSSSISTGSIVTAGGVGVAKNLYVGVNANIAGTLDVTGAVTVTNPVINNIKLGYTTTATAAGTTTLTAASNYQQFFTGTLAQTIVLPVTSTLALGMGYHIENNSTGTLTVQSSGLNTISTIPAGVTTQFTCILITGTTAASWDYDHIGFATITGTGSAVLATSPTITTPTISQLSSAAATALTLQSAGTTAITVDTSQNVGIGTASPSTYGTGLAIVNSTAFGGISVKCTATTGASQVYVANDAGTADAFLYAFNSASGNVNTAIGTSKNNAVEFYQNNSEKMRIDSSGNLLVGTTTSSGLLTVQTGNATAGTRMVAFSDSNGRFSGFYQGADGTTFNAANTALGVRSITGTGRSINASGTVNASGADYAEYMTKAGNFTVAKGDVVGIDANGKLTNIFADAVSFVVKSTNPSYVGGDVWGNEDSIGLIKPEKPTQRQATEEIEAETDEEFAARLATYETEKIVFDTALETARQLVDRIAFSGQVPVNVMGATAGQYIIPVNNNGAIKGEAVSNLTFEQYQIAVGKVISIESDGRARIIVKVA